MNRGDHLESSRMDLSGHFMAAVFRPNLTAERKEYGVSLRTERDCVTAESGRLFRPAFKEIEP